MSVTIEINDLTGISTLLCKLIDAFQNGCSWALKPYQIKRIAKAKSVASSTEINIELKKHLKEALMAGVIDNTNCLRKQRQYNNVTDIIANAAIELSMVDKTFDALDETPVDVDWSARFFDYAKDISDEEAKIIWGKILAGEIKTPGSYFKRTLSVLRNIETIEAKWFVEASQYIIDFAFPTTGLNYFKYNQLQSLFDCGLFTQDNCRIDYDVKTLELNGKSIILKKVADEETAISKISLSGFAMTDAGVQLYELINVQSHQAHMLHLKDVIEQKYNIKMELIHTSQ